ncbi:MAG: NAD(P)H-hydrate epimerase, partial [Vicinamibacterales bacterium]
IPSGLDGTTGAPADPTIEAAATMPLALPKRGLRVGTARRFVGELYLADIGVPPGLYARAPLDLAVPPLFARGDLVRLT